MSQLSTSWSNASSEPVTASKPLAQSLRPVFETVFAFAPNRETLGGTAYLLLEATGNILIDCPAWDADTQTVLTDYGVQWLFFSHRGGMGSISQVKALQQQLQCQILVQEQEAYLLPGLELTRFHHGFQLSPTSEAIWTPGHSPGSACLYHQGYGGILFTGRHLLPNSQGRPMPLRLAKTFHWPRQIQNLRQLCDRFTSDSLNHICPGANIGFLRGQRSIERAYEQIAGIDLEDCLRTKVGL